MQGNQVLPEGTQRTQGRSAQEVNIMVAKMVAGIVRTTLGPKGMDKMLVDAMNDVTVTNDGVTILREMTIENPTAKMMVEIAKTQEDEVGDGPQPLYSKVLTPNGFVEMGSLKVGDKICGTEGSIQEVLGVFPKGIKQICKVKFSDGTIIECCEDHLWHIKNCEGHSKVLTTRKLIENKEKWDTPYYTPRSFAEFDKKKFVIEPYLLGVLLGDGSLSNTGQIEISLGIAKEFIIDKIKLPLGINKNVTLCEDKNYFRVKISGKTEDGKSIYKLIEELGLLGTTSHTKFIPKQYLYSDMTSRIALLQGLSDTDGYINKRGLLEYSTVSEQLYNDILELLHGLGKETYSRLHTRENDNSYSDNNIFRISGLKGYLYGNKITNVEKTESTTEMQCIKVSNEDNLYFTDGYKVTHNTTTAVILAGELLSNAERLLKKRVHATVIAKGYKLTAEKALDILELMSIDIKDMDENQLRGILLNIAQTAMTGKGTSDNRDLLAGLVVDCVLNVAEKSKNKPVKIDKKNIKLEEVVGGSIRDSQLIEGIIIDKKRCHPNMPLKVNNAGIALLDAALEPKDMDAKINISSPSEMNAFLNAESEYIKKLIDTITGSGANVVLCGRNITEGATHFLSKAGIYTVKGINREDMEKISKATGARIITNIEELTPEDIGEAGIVEEKEIGESVFTFVNQCVDAKSMTLLVRGSTEQVTAEVKRAVEDALGDVTATIKYGKVVGGAGAPEIILAQALYVFANTLGGREQLAARAFAEAMESIPETLAENAGLDPIDIMTDLRSKTAAGGDFKWPGINVFTGKIMDAWEEGVIEPLKIKTQAVSSAAEVAQMVLRIDDVISIFVNPNKPPQGAIDKIQQGAGA